MQSTRVPVLRYTYLQNFTLGIFALYSITALLYYTYIYVCSSIPSMHYFTAIHVRNLWESKGTVPRPIRRKKASTVKLIIGSLKCVAIVSWANLTLSNIAFVGTSVVFITPFCQAEEIRDILSYAGNFCHTVSRHRLLNRKIVCMLSACLTALFPPSTISRLPAHFVVTCNASKAIIMNEAQLRVSQINMRNFSTNMANATLLQMEF